MKQIFALICLLSTILGSVTAYDHFLNDGKWKDQVLPKKGPMMLIQISDIPGIMDKIQGMADPQSAEAISMIRGMIPQNIEIAVFLEKEDEKPKIRVVGRTDLEAKFLNMPQTQNKEMPVKHTDTHTYIGILQVNDEKLENLIKKFPEPTTEQGVFFKIKPSGIQDLLQATCAKAKYQPDAQTQSLMDIFALEIESIQKFHAQVIFKEKTIEIDQVTRVNKDTPFGKLITAGPGPSPEKIAKLLPLLDQSTLISIDTGTIMEYMAHIQKKANIKELEEPLYLLSMLLTTWEGTAAKTQNLKTGDFTIVIESSISTKSLKILTEKFSKIEIQEEKIGSLTFLKIPMGGQEILIGSVPPVTFISNSHNQINSIIRDLKKINQSKFNLKETLELGNNQTYRTYTKIQSPIGEIIINSQNSTYPEKGESYGSTHIKMKE